MKLLSRLNRLKYIYFRARSLSIAVPAAKRDLFKAIVFVSLIYWLSWHFDAAEQLSGFTSRYETMQLDELPIAMLMAALAGIWFSRRRM